MCNNYEALQVQREQKALEAATVKVTELFDKAQKDGRVHETQAGKRFIRLLVQEVSCAIDNGLKGPGRKPRALAEIRYLGSHETALIALTLMTTMTSIETAISMTKLSKIIGRALVFSAGVKRLSQEDKEQFKQLKQLQKRFEGQGRKDWQIEKAIYTKLRQMVSDEIAEKFEDEEYKIAVGSWVMARVLEATQVFEQVKLDQRLGLRLKPEAHVKIAELLNMDISTAFTFPVMVCKPNTWVDGNAPYLTHNVPPVSFVKQNAHLKKEEAAPAALPLYAQAVDTLQQTAWEIDPFTYGVMSTLIKREDVAELFANRSFKQAGPLAWQRKLAEEMGELLELQQTEQIDGFYIPHNIDYRGRIYALPSISYQGPDHIKGCLRFRKGKPIEDKAAANWLFIHCANTWGEDKAPFEERIQWVWDNLEALFDYVHAPLENMEWLKADKPFQFLQAARDVIGFLVHGYGYVSRTPVAIDGTCSGIQHYAMMMRDRNTGKLVNLVPSDTVADIYGTVARHLKGQVEEFLGDLTAVEHREEVERIAAEQVCYTHNVTYSDLMRILSADHNDLEKAETEVKKAYYRITESWGWYRFGINRKLVKRAVMTFVYSSKTYGFGEQLKDDFLKPMPLEQAERLFTVPEYVKEAIKNDPTIELSTVKSPAAARVLAVWLWESITDVVQAPVEAMRFLQKVAAYTAKEGTPIRWVTPAGMRCVQRNMKEKHHQFEMYINGKRLKLAILRETKKIDSRRQQSAIGPNFIHSMDAAHLVRLINRMKEEGVMELAAVHDAYATTAADMPSLYPAATEELVTMYEQDDWLKRFAKSNGYPDVLETGNWELEEVNNAPYAFA